VRVLPRPDFEVWWFQLANFNSQRLLLKKGSWALWHLGSWALGPNAVDQHYSGPAASCCGIIGTHSIWQHYSF
jgi:hypothetical protein